MAIDHGYATSTADAESTGCADPTDCDGTHVRCEPVEPLHVPASALAYGREAFEAYRAAMRAQGYDYDHGVMTLPPAASYDALSEAEQQAWGVAAVQMWTAGHDVAAKVSQAVRTAEGRMAMTALQNAVGSVTHAALDQAYERGGLPATVSQLDPADPTQEGSER